jgi:hypothetical protein
LASAQKTKLSEAQEEIARQRGFQSFALLIHAAQVQDCWPATDEGVHAAFSSFIQRLDDETLRYFVRHAGTVWVDQDDFIAGRLTADSFKVLGNSLEGYSRQTAWDQNLVLALDATGMSDGYYFDEEDNDETFDSQHQQIYTPESAKEWILESTLEGGMLDSIACAIESDTHQVE